MVRDIVPLPRGSLSRSTLERLHVALERYASSPEADGTLREALAAVGVEARARGVPPEQVLVDLKQAWSRVPDMRARGARPSSATALQHVVTMCIKEYFR